MDSCKCMSCKNEMECSDGQCECKKCTRMVAENDCVCESCMK